jgi:hypothetical protein
MKKTTSCVAYARKNCTFITIPFSNDDKFKRKRGKIKAIKVDMLTSKMEFTFFEKSFQTPTTLHAGNPAQPFLLGLPCILNQ